MKDDPVGNESIFLLLFEGMDTSRGQEINRFHKLPWKHSLMEHINIHLLPVYKNVITLLFQTCRKSIGCVKQLVCWVRSKLELRNSASRITEAKEKLRKPEGGWFKLKLLLMAPGSLQGQSSCWRSAVQHTHTHTHTFLTVLCASLLGDNWNGQIKNGRGYHGSACVEGFSL